MPMNLFTLCWPNSGFGCCVFLTLRITLLCRVNPKAVGLRARAEVELSIGLIPEKPIVEGFAKCKDQFWPFSVGIKGKKQNKIVRFFKKWNACFYRPFIFWNILQVVNEQICLVRCPPSDYGKTRGVSHCGLAIYIKKVS